MTQKSQVIMAVSIMSVFAFGNVAAAMQEYEDLKVMWATQYANLSGAYEEREKETILRATASWDDYTYCFYAVLNNVPYPGGYCLAPMGFYEMRKYDTYTGDVVASRELSLLDYDVSNGLTVANNGSLWGVDSPHDLVRIHTSDLSRARLVQVNIPGYGIWLYDITSDPADTTNSLYVCGKAAVEGTTEWQSFAAKIDSVSGRVVWFAVYPDGEGMSKMAADGTIVGLINRQDDGQNVLFHDAASGSIVSISSSLDMQANGIAVSESAGCAVVAGYKGNGPNGGSDACVVAIDPTNGSIINTLIFGSPADDRINDVDLLDLPQQEPTFKYNLLAAGTTGGDLFGPGQSSSGFVAKIQMDYGDTLTLTGGSQFSAEGGDAAFYSGYAIQLGGGGQYFFSVTGTTTTSFYGGEYNGADTESSVAILAPDPVPMVEALIAKVEGMNLHQGIENSLDVKLENAKKSLESVKAGNRQDAVNKLQAFINECAAQTGQKLTVEQADELIADADAIIAALLLS